MNKKLTPAASPRDLHCLAAGIAVSLCSGCAFLPLPRTTDVAPEVNGTIRDSKTGQPLAGAEIQVNRSTFSSHRISDSQGHFQIPPLSQFHWATFWSMSLGPQGMFPVQWSDVPHAASPAITVTAAAPGHQSATVTITDPYRSRERVSSGRPWTVDFKLKPQTP